MQTETFALIVGGGPVGLAAAIELNWRSVPTVLVTENLATAQHPKCNNTNARSMEHFRRLGIAGELRSEGLPPGLPQKPSHDETPGRAEPAGVVVSVATGGHYDPEGTKAHKGPGGGGHKGDLPKLEVNPKGTANAKLKVAGLKLADVRGKALVIHSREAWDDTFDILAAAGPPGRVWHDS